MSVEFDDYRQRYHWVRKGIEFLIMGTQYNKREAKIPWNVGWFTGSAPDDGWFGYGSVKPLSAPRRTTATALKPSKTLPVITASADPNRPHFGSKPADPASSSGSDQTKPDQSKPDTTTSSTTSPSTSDDPNRPTMKHRTPVIAAFMLLVWRFQGNREATPTSDGWRSALGEATDLRRAG